MRFWESRYLVMFWKHWFRLEAANLMW